MCRSNKSKISPQINLLDSPVITKRSKSTKNCFESRFLLEQMPFVAQGSVYGIQLYILLAFLPLSPVILYCIPVAAASSILVVMLYLPICVMQVSRDVQIHSISHAYWSAASDESDPMFLFLSCRHFIMSPFELFDPSGLWRELGMSLTCCGNFWCVVSTIFVHLYQIINPIFPRVCCVKGYNMKHTARGQYTYSIHQN